MKLLLVDFNLLSHFDKADLKFGYVEDTNYLKMEKVRRLKKSKSRNVKRVRVIELGQVPKMVSSILDSHMKVG